MAYDESSRQSSLLQKFVRLITHNFWLKILSLFFSVVLFFMVRGDREITFDRVAKVKIVTLPDMVVMGPSERYVDVLVKQPNSLFSSPPSDIELLGEIDVLNEKPGRVRVKVTRDSFPNLSKQYLISVDRPFIEVDIDKFHEEKFPIQPVLIGKPKAGHIVTKVTVSPEEVRAAGALQILNKLNKLSTSPINIDGIDTSLVVDATIEIDPNLQILLNEKTARVSVNVTSLPETRVFRSVPIEVRGLNKKELEHLELRPSFVDVEISGDKEMLKDLNPSNVHAYLDTSNLKRGWQDKKVLLSIPEHTNLVRVAPDVVSVFIGR